MKKLLRACLQLPGFILGGFHAIALNNPSPLAGLLRRRRFGTQCLIDTGVTISNKTNFSSGTGCALYHGTYILNTSGTFQMGDESHLGAMCYVNVCYGHVHLGNHVAIGPHTSIIAYSNHYEKQKSITESRVQQDIKIGNNVFIGAHCTILPGTIIHDNVVVGAGSVVKGELKSNAVYAGRPCRLIREGWHS